MTTPSALLRRLDEIASALERSGRAVALLGLGSVGTQTARLDAWSDLDFFAVVEPGAKERFLHDLDWLTAAEPIAFAFRNTRDGHKVLFADGILCELAVFEPDELATIPFTPGRVVWHRPGVDVATLAPVLPLPVPETDVAWQLGEALTDLYVGLGRFHRGERLAAARLVQGHAVDRVLELASITAAAGPGGAAPPVHRDPFAPERRAEQRLPELRERLPEFVQGYERTPESARAILAYLDAHFDVDPAMHAAVSALAEQKCP